MFKTSITIEWGDCDEAGIVFYPNYFYWFDCAFQRLLRVRGLSQRELRRRFQAVTPIVKADAEFKAPARYDDEIEIAITIEPEGERKFRVDYHLSANGRTVAAGYEIRAFARIEPSGELKGARLDPDFLALMTAEPRHSETTDARHERS